ncbi:hypothetical protein Tco_0990524 [Tanacetum coccineum]|uniref:Transmembrane protein n=1 Tax=Tanacetum coccineum TaxID=301880 RepID=A0ABQ5EXW4_9ASTR
MSSQPLSLPNQQRLHSQPNPLSPSPPYPTTIVVGGWWLVCGSGWWWWVGLVVVGRVTGGDAGSDSGSGFEM